jgi:hypothetical protein
MSAASKWTLMGGVVALSLVLLFPGWRQTYQGHPLVYREEMGHHFVLRPPATTGEQSWILQAPASECKVEVKKNILLRQAAIVFAMTMIVLISFARMREKGSLAESLTIRRLAVISSLLALCLPVPPPDGIPCIEVVGMGLASPFMDNGHVGPWMMPILAGLSFGFYFAVLFAFASSLTWLIRWRLRVTAEGF